MFTRVHQYRFVNGTVHAPIFLKFPGMSKRRVDAPVAVAVLRFQSVAHAARLERAKVARKRAHAVYGQTKAVGSRASYNLCRLRVRRQNLANHVKRQRRFGRAPTHDIVVPALVFGIVQPRLRYIKTRATKHAFQREMLSFAIEKSILCHELSVGFGNAGVVLGKRSDPLANVQIVAKVHRRGRAHFGKTTCRGDDTT